MLNVNSWKLCYKCNNLSFQVFPESFRKFTDNFPNVTNFSQSSVDRFSTIFPKILYFNFDRKPYKWSGPSIRKCIDGPCSIIQPIRFQHFAYKHVVRLLLLLLTNCEVHTGKYLDCSFEVRTERSEVRTKN